MKKLLNKYVKNKKKGASMLDFFIYALVILLVGSAVFVLGGALKGGVSSVNDKADAINNQVTAGTTGYDTDLADK